MNKFNVGDKVIFIGPSHYEDLTPGKEYTIEDLCDEFIRITDDAGDRHGVFKKYFNPAPQDTRVQDLEQEVTQLKARVRTLEGVQPAAGPSTDTLGYALYSTGTYGTPSKDYMGSRVGKANTYNEYDNWRATEQEARNEQALRKLKKRFKDATAQLRKACSGPMIKFYIDTDGKVQTAEHKDTTGPDWMLFPAGTTGTYRAFRAGFTDIEIMSVIRDTWLGEDQ